MRIPSDVELYPFNYKNAKAGAPVCTRDRRKARIICWDSKTGDSPIIALISESDDERGEREVVSFYDIHGRNNAICNESNYDLMMPYIIPPQNERGVYFRLAAFDYDKAKMGIPVCTRDWRKARIICWNADTSDGKNIVALVTNQYEHEETFRYGDDGRLYGDRTSDDDLMLMVRVTKVNKYLNVCKDIQGNLCIDSTHFYGTKEDAERIGEEIGDNYLETVEVEVSSF